MRRNKLKIIIGTLSVILNISCQKNDSGNFKYEPDEESNPNLKITIATDKARYSPNEGVVFTLDNMSSNIMVRYKYLNTILKEEPLVAETWNWMPPALDFKGYMVELYKSLDDGEQIVGTVGVDVSSDWTKFPRYGFLSKYGDISDDGTMEVINRLNDFHINGLQCYDWQNKHHSPLKMDGGNPSPSWLDIANRTIYLKTVARYLKLAKSKNMASMAYNLFYGVWEDYASDGVSGEWLLYTDANHQYISTHKLPDNWASDLLLADPGNLEWQKYIFKKTKLMYQNLDFDGWHVDQLGDRGNVYDFFGTPVNLESTFRPFLENLKRAFPDKKMVLNAVNQYGQEEILGSPVDFAYTEVWKPKMGFKDLATIILDNNMFSDNRLSTVLAAYMDYDLADHQGVFNTPGVLLADAVIFAFGASHLELGEHMLGKEYFPNDNLILNDELKNGLRKYYDFLVAYQNLLRDGGTFNNPTIISGDGKINLNNWPPVSSRVSVIGKEWVDKQIIHLINFSDTNNLNWRDSNGNQNEPSVKKDLTLRLENNRPISKLWYASPDVGGGSSKELEFTQKKNNIVFTVPSLKYWDMIVIEYE